jgi:L-erythro-3,5-diaminohexanoate dehydrogenase
MGFRGGGHVYGLHRVVAPKGALPQAAERLDNAGPAFDNEIVIDVHTLNVDSASFHQIVADVGRDEDAVARRIESIVDERGKMQNPVTGSGGMLLGEVRSIGPNYQGPVEVDVGDTIATLVSLTLTPLELDSIDQVYFDADQVDVTGTAYLWPSSPLVRMPDDLPARLALSSLDVCGAPAQTKRLVEGASRVLVLGMGKSGMICAAAARDAMGPGGLVCGFDLRDDNLVAMKEAGIVDDFRCGNAQRPSEALDTVKEMADDALFDVVINTCNVPDTEMAAILACRDRGKVYFFNMATSFAKAALGCEGVGKDVDLLIGNGYAHGHAKMTLDLVRRFDAVRGRIETLLA